MKVSKEVCIVTMVVFVLLGIYLSFFLRVEEMPSHNCTEDATVSANDWTWRTTPLGGAANDLDAISTGIVR